MAPPLLETKLHAPEPRFGAVARRRLTDRLSAGARSKLTLVSAPPGFGKSTLVSAWIAAHPGPSAWLSLDVDDNDPATFWSEVIAALQTAAPAAGTGAAAILATSQPDTRLAVRSLLNDLVSLDDDVVLVLDDYHVIERTDVHEAVTFALDHLPPRLHVVLATRADPPLPLSRLRARGELVEIRATDLRFTSDEAEAYLNGTMGLHLTGADIGALGARTEGWIAALQLAALSLQGRDDAASFIAAFAGDDRHLLDYLVDEVLGRQPDDIRDFLLDTAVLERLTAALCDAVTGRDDSRAVLETLDRMNLFLVPLDHRREWFRYHHMFRDVLRVRLLDTRPGVAAGLHRRASDWFADHGEATAAITHATAAGDIERAADLMELAFPQVRRTRQELQWLGWMQMLPSQVLRARPVLSVAAAGVLMSAGDFDRVDELLETAERWLRLGPAERAEAGMIVLVTDELDRLPSAVALYRTAQARFRGDLPATMEQARRAIELAADDDLMGRGAAEAFLGLAYWTTGDLDAAYRWYTAGMTSMERAGHLADVVAGAVTQADIRIAQGRLTEALGVLERGLALATAGPVALRGVPDMHAGISDILRERGDLDGAMRHLDAAGASSDGVSYRQFPYRSRVVLARIRQAEGDHGSALRLLDEAQAVYVGEFSPDVRPIAAIRARMWIARRDLASAWAWARDRDLTATDPLSFVREFEHATLARLLLAQGIQDHDDGAIRDASALAGRLVDEAAAGERTGSVLDALVVLALAEHAGRNEAAALRTLDRAVALAEPEGHVRVFLDEGPPMMALLQAAVRRSDASTMVRQLHAAGLRSPGRSAASRALVEPLSERELEILRLLDTDLDGPGIARELVISVSTVRTHIKNVYAKLGVNDRRSAVRRAAELDLLTRPRR